MPIQFLQMLPFRTPGYTFNWIFKTITEEEADWVRWSNKLKYKDYNKHNDRILNDITYYFTSFNCSVEYSVYKQMGLI